MSQASSQTASWDPESNTIVVLVFLAVVVALVSGLDLFFDTGVFWIFA
jgi:hypothetical protein